MKVVVRIHMNAPFPQGSEVSRQREEALAIVVDALNDVLHRHGLHMRGMYLDSGAQLGLALSTLD